MICLKGSLRQLKSVRAFDNVINGQMALFYLKLLKNICHVSMSLMVLHSAKKSSLIEILENKVEQLMLHAISYFSSAMAAAEARSSVPFISSSEGFLCLRK